MALRHDSTHPRPNLWGSDHTTGDESEGDHLVYRDGEWVAEAIPRRIVVMRPGITNPPEPVVNVDGDGWVYAEL